MKKKPTNKKYEKQTTNLFNAIKIYQKAFTCLAEVMAGVKSEHGRQTLEQITDFDVSRINILCGIGNLPLELCEDLLPETLTELIGLPLGDIAHYAGEIKKGGLKASQVRKLIRKNKKTVHTIEKKTKVSTWGKHILLLENEIKGMDASTKARAIAHLANTITSLK